MSEEKQPQRSSLSPLRIETVLAEILRSLAFARDQLLPEFEEQMTDEAELLLTSDLSSEVGSDLELRELLAQFELPSTEETFHPEGFEEIEAAMVQLTDALQLTPEQSDLLYALPVYRAWVENAPSVGSGAQLTEPHPEILTRLTRKILLGIRQWIEHAYPDASLDWEKQEQSLLLRFYRHTQGPPQVISPRAPGILFWVIAGLGVLGSYAHASAPPTTCAPGTESQTLESMDQAGTSATFCRIIFKDETPVLDAWVSPLCTFTKKSTCGALELRKITRSPKSRSQILGRIARVDLNGGKNPAHLICAETTEIKALLDPIPIEYWKIPESGSQLATCRHRDGSRISIDAL
jgi:hypothetical protein